ncbi:AMP-binding protein [Rhizobium sp. AN95]|uniref:AMP-binding protein n=1 Tax=Rhizobium sp. AN95 TaxID=3035216 RepID=UPI002B257DEA|nr:AMP-binding protein [Rhizobium sp. AN95]
MTTHILLHHLLTARAESGDEALVYKDKSLSYREFSEAAARCAAALQEAGTERGDRVVIFLPRGIEECWSIFGVSMASCVFVPVNALLKAQQIRHIVADCGAKIVISSATMMDELNAVCGRPARGHCTAGGTSRPPPARACQSLAGNWRGPCSNPLHIRLHRLAQGRDAVAP